VKNPSKTLTFTQACRLSTTLLDHFVSDGHLLEQLQVK